MIKRKLYGTKTSNTRAIHETMTQDVLLHMMDDKSSFKSSLLSYFPSIEKSKNHACPSPEPSACLLPLSSMKTNSKETQLIERSVPVYNQLFLDMGQKNFGHITCKQCGMAYDPSFEEDTKLHKKFHQKTMIKSIQFKSGTKEPIWAAEDHQSVIYVFSSKEIFKSHRKKIGALLKQIEDELGSLPLSKDRLERCQCDFIIGALITESQPPELLNFHHDNGSLLFVARLWVSRNERRRRIATHLMNAARNHSHVVIDMNKIAYSQPSEEGLAFAKGYANTQDIIIYPEPSV